MGDYAYLSLWFKDFTIERGLHHLEAVLTHFPIAPLRPGFRLEIRSLDPAQSPSLEADLLAAPADVRLAASEYLHNDTVYEVSAHWKLWLPAGGGEWEEGPSPVELHLQGEEFDDGRFRETGHLAINLRHEELYILPIGQPPQDYLRYARENARRLYAFLHALEKSLPVAERRLWSEGEEDFAARLEQAAGPLP